MPVTRSRMRAHAVEWHVVPAAHIDARHRADFLDLQRRCNTELCRHQALTQNPWLDQIESGMVAFDGLMSSLQQLAIFLRQLVLARERHALLLTERSSLLESDSGTAVVICFDENGMPWCPPLPGMGLGDPYVLSERLHQWWTAWQHSAGQTLQGWSFQQGWPATQRLCDTIDTEYNASDTNTALGVLLAVENGMSTDFWQRLGRDLRQRCDEFGVAMPDAGFFPVAETHARLQARHGLYLTEAASVHDLLEVEPFFRAGLGALDRLNDFWRVMADSLRVTH